MLTPLLARLVTHSIRRPFWVIAVSILLAVLSAFYVAHHFKISTDISQLIKTEPEWAARSDAIDNAFPQRGSTVLVVIEAPAPEFADAAANDLAAALSKRTDRFTAVSQPSGGDFFEHNGLLYLSTDKVASTTQQLVSARPLVNALAHDPTLTGLAGTLNTTLNLPLESGQVTLGQMSSLLNQSATVIDRVLANQPNQPAVFSWRGLADKSVTSPARAFVTAQPLVDYNALEPGATGSNAIRATAADLKLAARYGATVHLTGEQPLSDEEFASLKDGAVLNGILTFIVVLVILWLALRSGKMIVSVFITLFVGLAITAALGLMMVHALNLISVAFMVLFVGLGVDFGIQFGVRYRDERFKDDRLDVALVSTARHVGVPLTLAAAATAASFFSFLPTAYRGVSELGQIAGVGMLVAYFTNMTLFPALIKVFGPVGEAGSPGFPKLAPVDEYLAKHRKPVLIGTLLLIIAALPLLLHLRFDFNPLNLKDPKTESMATLISLKDAPEAAVNDVKVLAPSLAEADRIAAKLEKLPEVERATTLSTLIPADQPQKLALIAAAAQQLLPALNQTVAAPANDAVRVAALRRLSNTLANAADEHPGPGDKDAQHLSDALKKLAAADPAARDRAEHAIADPLRIALGQMRALLQPSPISRESLPRSMTEGWVAADGHALVEVSPKASTGSEQNDDKMLAAFSDAVQQAEPNAIGGPISVLHSAKTIIKAFEQAAALSLLSIAILLWLTLRRLGDVLRTLVPLLVSAVVTLELCVVVGMPLNFANIIALPLLLGVGVAFKIYFVMAWRAGHDTVLLQSSLTRAVLFSAATTATAFGSLWFSQPSGHVEHGQAPRSWRFSAR